MADNTSTTTKTTNIELIKKLLPVELQKVAQTFTIPEKFLKEMPNIIALILESKSMDTTEEKQSWFNLLPMMSPEQIAKLNDILTREKIKLSEIEKKYEEKKNNIKEKYVKRRESMWYEKKIDSIKEKEAAFEKKDDAEADKLLENI